MRDRTKFTPSFFAYLGKILAYARDKSFSESYIFSVVCMENFILFEADFHILDAMETHILTITFPSAVSSPSVCKCHDAGAG